MADFETKCEQHALDYIKIHLHEGYFVNAYVDKGTYYWENVYKIHASPYGEYWIQMRIHYGECKESE